STDARIDVYDLKTLEDDEQFFPPYDASSYVTQETLDEHPELEEIFEDLVGKFDLDTIRQLNRKVDEDGEEPQDVAKEYLEEEGMLDKGGFDKCNLYLTCIIILSTIGTTCFP